MTEKEIRDLFAQHGVELARSDVWQVQQALVIKHAALERLAAKLKIVFSRPQILRCERDEAVILVEGYIEGNEGWPQWSIGEACIGTNYRVSGKQAAYVWAMSEKRAKDRVILKLANLHGAYSEDEADDFKDAAPRRREDPPEHGSALDYTGPQPTDGPTESQNLIFAALGLGIEKAHDTTELELFKVEQIKPQLDALTEAQQADIQALYKDRYRSLTRRAA